MCDFSEYGGPSDEWLAVECSMEAQPVMELLEGQRITNEGRETVARQDMMQLASQLSINDYNIEVRDGHNIQGRSYRPIDIADTGTLPLYIHFHGGGFLFGTLASEDAICARIALKAHVVVLNVNYRHTPVFAYPTAWHDSQDAFVWAYKNAQQLHCDPEKIIVGGISAGGQLAASLTLQQHMKQVGTECSPIVGQILMIPCVAHPDCYDGLLAQMKDPSISSVKENENAPILSMKVVRMFVELLNVKKPRADDLVLNPGNASPDQVTGHPPTVFGIAGLDPLRDEGLLYAKLLTESGVATDINLFKGVPHGFRRFGDRLSASNRWDKVMEDGIAWILSKPPSSHIFKIKS